MEAWGVSLHQQGVGALLPLEAGGNQFLVGQGRHLAQDTGLWGLLTCVGPSRPAPATTKRRSPTHGVAEERLKSPIMRLVVLAEPRLKICIHAFGIPPRVVRVSSV